MKRSDLVYQTLSDISDLISDNLILPWREGEKPRIQYSTVLYFYISSVAKFIYPYLLRHGVPVVTERDPSTYRRTHTSQLHITVFSLLCFEKKHLRDCINRGRGTVVGRSILAVETNDHKQKYTVRHSKRRLQSFHFLSSESTAGVSTTLIDFCIHTRHCYNYTCPNNATAGGEHMVQFPPSALHDFGRLPCRLDSTRLEGVLPSLRLLNYFVTRKREGK